MAECMFVMYLWGCIHSSPFFALKMILERPFCHWGHAAIVVVVLFHQLMYLVFLEMELDDQFW